MPPYKYEAPLGVFTSIVRVRLPATTLAATPPYPSCPRIQNRGSAGQTGFVKVNVVGPVTFNPAITPPPGGVLKQGSGFPYASTTPAMAMRSSKPAGLPKRMPCGSVVDT